LFREKAEGDEKMTDEDVARKLRQKDIAVFDYIMEHYNKLLWAVVGNILANGGSTADIEDCISDVYVKLLENPKLYDHKKGSLKSLLVKIAKNFAIDRYRKLTRNASTEIFENSGAYDDDDLLRSMLTKESRGKILEALDHLKEPDREIIIRRYFFNEKVKVISEKTHLQSKEIENKLYQGKLKLRTILTGKEVF
jgi:RNA polymerase sigma-70 factor (ECF subfamily)